MRVLLARGGWCALWARAAPISVHFEAESGHLSPSHMRKTERGGWLPKPWRAWASLLICLSWAEGHIFAQAPYQPPPANGVAVPNVPVVPPSGLGQELVNRVVVQGNRTVGLAKIRAQLMTREGRPFQPEVVEEDIRRLDRLRRFLDVKSSYVREPGQPGITVIFQVVERPVIEQVRFVGNQKLSMRILRREVGVRAGDGLDPYAVEEGRRRIEEYYRKKGFNEIEVEVFEGNRFGDRRAVYLIHEGRKQRILWTSFVGNDPDIASDARLRKVVESKPGWFWIFKGQVDREQIDQDVDRLTAYYRSLGFFQARVGRDLNFDKDGEWLRLEFVIHQGPRYYVRNISFLGSTKFAEAALKADLKLREGDAFNQRFLTRDVSGIEDMYGGEGHIFADIQADTRFLEEPGKLDLVYRIDEGARYRIDKINVQIAGDTPHTRHNTVRNRISQRPGDVVDTRLIRDSKRRILASRLFAGSQPGERPPQISWGKTDLEKAETRLGSRPAPTGQFRGQSPDTNMPIRGATGETRR